ncbi:feruloyl-CoA synthase [Polyangium mundeleinium]|uniref:Feruloyl-CoA synthase n=1 Tax=Polyangium mundeleinium TaxID=2995306 RepID=A0ABT5F274_9BACT|nr:feruloyl-CoA synthase [Polyangium mundeleinium]MDC0747689.1 feruloyl-CoA synthase [Polyangium mundeleinium]
MEKAARLEFAPPEVVVTNLPGGGMILRSPRPLPAYPRHLGELLYAWADHAPDRVFLAEREASGGVRRVTYAEAAAVVASIGEALARRDLSAARPVVILSENGIDHALLALGAMVVGVPVCPVSPAYALLSRDFEKLRYILGLVKPGLVYARDEGRFGRAFGALDLGGAEIVVTEGPSSATRFDELCRELPGERAGRAMERVGPDTVAKILFTSGSTGEPKGVINTHRMLCSNQQAIVEVWPFLRRRPPVVVDWLPWSHTFGGNHNFNMVLFHGGTLFIDEGRPMPEHVEKTVRNLREVEPTLYFNVPRGFDAILPYLENDAGLRDHFFKELDLLFYAAAALPQSTWKRLEEVSQRARGERVTMVSAWGSTETAPMVTTVHFPIDRAGVIGLPAPGCELKMVPNGSKLEMRVRGPNVTPGYFGRDDLTRAAFDEEGFYKIGDAGKLADPGDPAKGVVFDGRVAEDFKLTSATWVHVGQVRITAIAAAAPVIQDAVVAGHDRDEIGLLVFPSLVGCRSLCPGAEGEPLDSLVQRPEVLSHLTAGLGAYNEAHPGSSTRITRVMFLIEPPSIDAGEITDKGYINQRAVLTRRADQVAALYRDGEPGVIVMG